MLLLSAPALAMLLVSPGEGFVPPVEITSKSSAFALFPSWCHVITAVYQHQHPIHQLC